MPTSGPNPVRAGKLRQYGAVQQFVKTATGDRGQPTGSWQTVSGLGAVPCEILPLTGRQLEISRQLVAEATHQITLRYHAGITPGMRVQYQARNFNIGYVSDGDMRKHYLVLTTIEQQTGAT